MSHNFIKAKSFENEKIWGHLLDFLSKLGAFEIKHCIQQEEGEGWKIIHLLPCHKDGVCLVKLNERKNGNIFSL